MDFLKQEQKNLEQDKLDILSAFSKTLSILRGKSDEEIVNRIIAGLAKTGEQISIATLEQVVKVYKEKERDISQVQIPTLLNENGLSKIALKEGKEIVVQDKVKGSITQGNKETAYKNMIQSEIDKGLPVEEAKENIDSLFKSKIEIELDNEIIQYLIDNDVLYETKRDIHYATLNKYCKEKLEKGETIPEGISHYEYQETKLK